MSRTLRALCNGFFVPSTTSSTKNRACLWISAEHFTRRRCAKVLQSVFLLLLVAACGRGGGSGVQPSGLDDACNILSQRPGYLKAFKAAERKWGVPVAVQMAEGRVSWL